MLLKLENAPRFCSYEEIGSFTERKVGNFMVSLSVISSIVMFSFQLSTSKYGNLEIPFLP